MKVLEHEIQALRDELVAMSNLVYTQISKCKEAIENQDMNLASEVIHSEKKVNSYELKIDKDCENLLALYTPVASDLKFVLACLKINYNLERIGDHISAIARYTLEATSTLSSEITTRFNLYPTLDLAMEMVEISIDAIKNDDSQEVRKVFLMDDQLDHFNSEATKIVEHLINEGKDISACIATLSLIRKLERIGDHTKNIAEELIFYIDAKVVKHRPKRIRKIKEKLSKSDSNPEEEE